MGTVKRREALLAERENAAAEKKAALDREIAVVEAEVDQLKRYLTAPADATFPFQPTLWRLKGQNSALLFRKLTYPELLKLNFPHIPPRFTQRHWAQGEWDALPDEMKQFWREPREPTKPEANAMRASRLEIVRLTNMDGKQPEEFEGYDPDVLNECFGFVANISGFSDDALELLDWFRQQQ